jgi:uncharacterized protein (DUF433 family)
MPVAQASLLERITSDPAVRFGKPCIRGHRITVQEILAWLSEGASQQQILKTFLLSTLMLPNWLLEARSPKDEPTLRRKPFAEAG